MDPGKLLAQIFLLSAENDRLRGEDQVIKSIRQLGRIRVLNQYEYPERRSETNKFHVETYSSQTVKENIAKDVYYKGN